jgi:hypothetical protein
MAVRQLILSDPLCFIVNKLCKVPLKPLKKTLSDFYSPADITRAKNQLLNDIVSLVLTDKLPHIPNRRDGDDRQVREIDDIFTMITFLDERKILDSLPIYVTDNPDKMPTMQLFEGDFSFMSARLDKLDTVLSNHGSMLTAILRDELQARRPLYSTVAQKGVIHNKPVEPTGSATGLVHSGPSGHTGKPNTGDAPARVTMATANDEHVNTNNTEQLIPEERYLWSDKTDGSVLRNIKQHRILSELLASSDADTVDAPESTDGQHFTVFNRRRVAKKRRRDSPQETRPSADVTANHSTQVRRGPLMVGKSSAFNDSIQNRSIAAATAGAKKFVFCIDNVNPDYSEIDIRNFVSKLNVAVVTCFEVKPRKRYSDDGDHPIPRKAFRLCIHSNDRDRLLDASKWPERVAIYDYFFKKKESNNVNMSNHDLTQGQVNSQTTPHTPSVNLSGATLSSHTVQSSLSMTLDIGHSNPAAAEAGSGVVQEDKDGHADVIEDINATILTHYSPGSKLTNTDTLQSTNHGSS